MIPAGLMPIIGSFDPLVKLNERHDMKWIRLAVAAIVGLASTVLLHGQPVTKIAAGNGCSLIVRSDGSLWATGYNQYGEFGDGTYSNTNRFEQVVSNNVTAVAAGYYHTLFLKSDGSLWATGYNYEGELGDGNYNTFYPNGTNRPEKIVASGVAAIAAGNVHSLFLMTNGSLWGMGKNDNGQLGNASYYWQTNRPALIVASNVTAIAAGFVHTLFLKNDGSLWAMGNNYYGQLGDDALGGGTLNSKTNQPEQIVSSNVTAIAAGAYHSIFIKSDGSLWGMGYNLNGQLGDGTSGSNNWTNKPEQIVGSNVIAIASGCLSEHSLFIKTDGSLWGMGENQYGALGDGTYSKSYPNGKNKPEQILSSNVTAISIGGNFSLFLKTDGSLWGMGQNVNGQLGDGTYYNRNLPEQIIAIPLGYNQISGQFLSSGDIRLSFVGISSRNYALDRFFNLATPNWSPQVTNQSDTNGVLVFTNKPDSNKNNFWRIRSVQ